MEKNENETKTKNHKKIFVILLIVLFITMLGLSFAYYFAILKGENINTAKASDATIIYTEPETGIETKQMSDYLGMTNNSSYDFSVTGQSDGTTNLNYTVYLAEEANNTIEPSQIHYYITDEDNYPIPSHFESKELILDTSDNTELVYTEGRTYNIEIKNSTNVTQITGTSADPETSLFEYYAKNILKLTGSEQFYINYFGEECRSYYYNDDISSVSVDYEIVDNSMCNNQATYKYNESTDNHVLENTENGILAYLSYNYIGDYLEVEGFGEIDNSSNIEAFLAQQVGFAETGQKFYFPHIIKIASNEYPYSVSYTGEYCAEYELVTDDSGDTENKKRAIKLGIVENSNCESAKYKIIDGIGLPQVLGELDEESLTNIVMKGSFHYMNGKLSDAQSSNLKFDERIRQKTRNYKLRYWISSATNTNPSGNQEITPTTEGNSHTVNFGNTGIFKFKVNVYASQSELEY